MHTIFPKASHNETMITCGEAMKPDDLTTMARFFAAAITHVEFWFSDQPDRPIICFLINEPFAALYEWGAEQKKAGVTRINVCLSFGLTSGQAQLRCYNVDPVDNVSIRGETLWTGKYCV